VNDGITEAQGSANETLNFTSTSSIGAWSGLTASLPVSVVDNDDGASSYGVVIAAAASLTVNEASGSTTYTARLSKAPSANVVLRATAATGLSMGTTGTSLTIRANNDGTAEGFLSHAVTHSITANAGGYTTGIAIQPLTVLVNDNDTRILLAHVGNNETRVSEDGDVSDTITVVLQSAPTVPVEVNLGSNFVKCTPSHLVFWPTTGTMDPGATLRDFTPELSSLLVPAEESLIPTTTTTGMQATLASPPPSLTTTRKA
jgi:hypothetical protein